MKAPGQSFFVVKEGSFRILLLLGSLLGGFACSPKIGADCSSSVDCSISGDRLCDATQPGGYCTVFNCEPNGCPDEAVCVAFGEGTCTSAPYSTRLRRTFCMRSCEEESDCRGGSYHCMDVSNDPSRRIVDSNPSSRRICAVAPPSPEEDAGSNPEPPKVDPPICFPSDAAFDVSRPETGPKPIDASVDSDTEGAESSTVDATGEGARADTVDDSTSDATADQVTPDAIDDAADEPETPSFAR